MKEYTKKNAEIIDRWISEGWEWGQPISIELYHKAQKGEWDVVLTPTKVVLHEWFGDTLKGKKLLGLASGGAQQMPIFAALGAECTVLDYSTKQIESEVLFAKQAGYPITTVQYDMTQPLPFEDGSFDIIFHPVSNCYVEDIDSIFKECYRILKPGGIMLSGFDNGINYITNDETTIENSLPFNPLINPDQMKQSIENDYGIQFSHTFGEQIGGQLKADFTLTDLFEDTNGSGRLHDLRIPCYVATRVVK